MRITALSGAAVLLCTMADVTLAQNNFYSQSTPYTQTQSTTQSLNEQIIPARERAHDFGSVARAAKTEHRFQIRNPFQQPMHLASISASCGCTTPIIESQWIQPGEIGTVLARFNTGTFSGDRKASLNLTIDKPQFMQLQLNVKGYIRTDIVINPGELNFGSVAEGQSKQIEANVEYAGRSDWKILGINSNSQFIDASVEETARSAGRVAYKIKAKLNPGLPAGSQSTMLTLQTNDNRLKSVPLACMAQIQAPLSASPNSVALGEMKRGQNIQQRILLKGTEPFQVLNINLPNMQVQFDPIEEPKAIQFVNVTIIPSDDIPAGDFKGSMTIVTDLDGEREISLDVSGKILVPSQPVSQDDENPELSDKVSSRLFNSAR